MAVSDASGRICAHWPMALIASADTFSSGLRSYC